MTFRFTGNHLISLASMKARQLRYVMDFVFAVYPFVAISLFLVLIVLGPTGLVQTGVAPGLYGSLSSAILIEANPACMPFVFLMACLGLVGTVVLATLWLVHANTPKKRRLLYEIGTLLLWFVMPSVYYFCHLRVKLQESFANRTIYLGNSCPNAVLLGIGVLVGLVVVAASSYFSEQQEWVLLIAPPLLGAFGCLLALLERISTRTGVRVAILGGVISVATCSLLYLQMSSFGKIQSSFVVLIATLYHSASWGVLGAAWTHTMIIIIRRLWQTVMNAGLFVPKK